MRLEENYVNWFYNSYSPHMVHHVKQLILMKLWYGYKRYQSGMRRPVGIAWY